MENGKWKMENLIWKGGVEIDSRNDYTDRVSKRENKERRVLFPNVQGQTDRTTMPEEMERYAGTKSRQGAVCG